VVETAKVLAEVRGVSFETIAEQSTANFYRLFAKVPPAALVQPATSQQAPAPR
jgi:TatD DNase family protein